MRKLVYRVADMAKTIYLATIMISVAIGAHAYSTAPEQVIGLGKVVIGYLGIMAITFGIGVMFFGYIKTMRSPREKVYSFYLLALAILMVVMYILTLQQVGYSSQSFIYFCVVGLWLSLVRSCKQVVIAKRKQVGKA